MRSIVRQRCSAVPGPTDNTVLRRWAPALQRITVCCAASGAQRAGPAARFV